MRIQQINRSDAEKVFGIYRNYTSGTLAVDTVVQLYAVASAGNGNQITTPTTGSLDLVIGINDASLATMEYGNVQLYGYRATSALYVASGVTPALGDKLLPVAGQTYLQYGAAGDGRDGFFAAMGTGVASSTATQKTSVAILVRCM